MFWQKVMVVDASTTIVSQLFFQVYNISYKNHNRIIFEGSGLFPSPNKPQNIPTQKITLQKAPLK